MSLSLKITFYSSRYLRKKYPSHMSDRVLSTLLLMALRSSHQRCSIKMVFLKITPNSQENTCARVSFLIKLWASVYNFIKKRDSGTGVSSEFCEIFRNNFFTEPLQETATGCIDKKLLKPVKTTNLNLLIFF